MNKNLHKIIFSTLNYPFKDENTSLIIKGNIAYLESYMDHRQS